MRSPESGRRVVSMMGGGPTPRTQHFNRPGKTFAEELDLRYLSPGAFTVLSPDEHGSPPDPPTAPQPYRLSPKPKRNRNQSFAIIAEPWQAERSRSPSPSSGRVSPFRGRGFNAAGSRHASPISSPPASSSGTRIPQPKRSSGPVSLAVTDSGGFPLRKKNGTIVKPVLSKSLNNIGPGKKRGFSRLSPIVGSSPEYGTPRGSRVSTPKGYSYSTPTSRKQSPNRDVATGPGGASYGTGSYHNLGVNIRETIKSPTRIPIYRGRTERNRGGKPRGGETGESEGAADTEDTDNNNSRSDVLTSETETDRKPPSNSNSRRNSLAGSVKNVRVLPKATRKPSVRNLDGTKKETIKRGAETLKKGLETVKRGAETSKKILETTKKNVEASKKNVETSKKNIETPRKNEETPRRNEDTSGKSENNVKTETTKKSVVSTNKNSTVGKSKKTSSTEKLVKIGSRSNLNEGVKTASKGTGGTSAAGATGVTSAREITSTPGGTTSAEGTNTTGGNSATGVTSAAVAKVRESSATAAATVTNTTAAVTQPLKIENPLDMLSTGSASNAKGAREAGSGQTGKQQSDYKLKETPMYMDEDVQQLQQLQHNQQIHQTMNPTHQNLHQPQTNSTQRLSPQANAIISLSTTQQKNLPPVETATVGNGNNGTFHHGNNNNTKTTLSPEDGFGARVTNSQHHLGANERIREARTMVASDVKPIRINVAEKPDHVDVQSGNNVRFSAVNGSSPGVPHQDHQQPVEEVPQSRCGKLMRGLCCCCFACKKNEADGKSSGFSCCKKQQKDVEAMVSPPEAEEDGIEKGKRTFLEKLRCCGRCRSNKISDSSCCGGGNRRKDSWAERRDSILSEPPKLTAKSRCRNFFAAIFCCACCKRCRRESPPPVKVEDSRRASMMSKKKSLTPTVVPPEEPKSKLDSSLVEYTSTMKAAIPVLPVALAYFCLIFNVIAPGTGTVFSGLFCLCMGIPRFSQRDGPKARIGSFLINAIIGCGQLFTVLFCLVGWGWSIWWGVIMLKISKKHKKLKRIEERLEAQERLAAANAVPATSLMRDPEKGKT